MKTAIYIRVSTLEQAAEGFSLAAQEKTLKQWANNNGEITVFADKGISGKNINRPAMQAMLEQIKKDKFDAVLCWSLSRLTRSVPDLYAIWHICQKHRCDIKSYTEAFDTSTPTGRAMMGLLGVFAQMEREITAERTKAAMQERAAQGKRTCNEVLGYDLDGKDSLAVNPREAEQVKFIFSEYLEKRNFSAVAESCRLRGYTGKRGKPLKPESVKKILKSPIYIGYNRYKKTIYKGLHEPIIDKAVWDIVQNIVQDLHKK